MDCVIQCEENAKMRVLTEEEYPSAKYISDGTLKWYKCDKCGGVFIMDKMSRSWKISPETYTDLVNKGILKNLLNS